MAAFKTSLPGRISSAARQLYRSTRSGLTADFSRATRGQLWAFIDKKLVLQQRDGLPALAAQAIFEPVHRGQILEKGLVDPDKILTGFEYVQARPKDGGLQTELGRGDLEWWYGRAFNQDKTTWVNWAFCTSDLMANSGPPQIWFSYGAKRGEKEYRGSTYAYFGGAGQFSAATDHCDVRLTDPALGENRLWVEYPDGIERPGVWHLVLKVKDGQHQISLELTGTPDNCGWKAGTSDIYNDPKAGHNLSYAVLAYPSGGVQGKLLIDGEDFLLDDSLEIDHNWGNMGPQDALAKWYWAQVLTRASTGPAKACPAGDQPATAVISAILSQVFFRPIIESPPLNIASRFFDNVLSDSTAGRWKVKERHWRRDAEVGTNYPTTLTFIPVDKADPSEITITGRGQPTFRKNLLDGLPWWKRWLARTFVARPAMYRFNGDVVMTLADPQTHQVILHDLVAADAGEFEVVILDDFFNQYETAVVAVKKFFDRLHDLLSGH